VKPGNVLEADDGHYVLCDLGIATCPEPSATRLTATEQLLGTFLYMSPEQRNDPHRVDARADQYGVASTLWFAVLGRSPPDLSLLYLQPQLLDKLPVELREVVRRGTAYAAADRYPSVSAMAEALRVAMRHSRH
jgi:serine/threonine-protein kinase